MRGALKYGVPIAAGLGVGGYALSQGEDPGSAALAAGTGALGAGAGLLGARLAGKYMAPDVAQVAQGLVNSGTIDALESLQKNLVAGPKGGLRRKAAAGITKGLGNLRKNVEAGNAPVILGGQVPGSGFERNLQKGIATAAVPAAALTAGLGGVALGAIPGAVGVPGFQQGMAIDPESPGSSNTASAKYGVTPYASTQYM
jgi:hypothetical protein